MNENLSRWVWASFIKYFKSVITNIPLYIEGQDLLERVQDAAEFRMDGPDIIQPSKNYYVITVDINILLTSIKDDKDDYKVQRYCGLIASAFALDVKMYKYGNGLLDTGEQFGCMQRGEEIRVNNFGLVQSTNRVIQSAVESRYKMILS